MFRRVALFGWLNLVRSHSSKQCHTQKEDVVLLNIGGGNLPNTMLLNWVAAKETF